MLHLETYLEQLKTPPTAGIDADASSTGQDLAMAELLKRAQAEEINRLLKTIMNNQLQIHDALKNVFEESAISTNNSFLATPDDDI